ncbi:TraC family protein [Thiotrichales bacterium 19S11-10]|nr:TraC family protein [Thiotrichales bacterium 19S11-10]
MLLKKISEKLTKAKSSLQSDVIDELTATSESKVPHFHHQLPYRYFDKEKGIFINEYKTSLGCQVGYGFGREIAPLAGSSRKIPESLNDMICKKLPTGKKWGYQFVLTADRKVSEMIETNRKLHAQKGQTYAKLAQYQADMANKALVDGFSNGFGKAARFDLKNYRSFFFAYTLEKDLEKIIEVKEETENDLSTLGTSFRDMDAEDFIAYMGNIINHNALDTTLPKIRYNEFLELNQQCFDQTTTLDKVNRKYLDFKFYDDTKAYLATESVTSRVVCLTLKRLPTELYHWELQKFLSSFRSTGLSLACPFMWSVNFQIESKGASDAQVNAKITNLSRSAESGLGRFFPFLNDEIEEYREIQRGLAGDIYRICNFSVDLILFTDEVNWRRDISTAERLYRDGLELRNAEFLQSQSFLSILPFQYARFSKERHKSGTRHRAKSSNISNMLPIVGDYKGSCDMNKSSPYRGLSYGLLTPTRTNQVAFFSPFIMGTDSYNIVIAGAMGSGKSVLAQSLILDIISMGGLVWAFDKGGSYRDMCRAIGGQMINAASLHLNPFSHLDYDKMANDPELINDPEFSLEASFQNSIAMITDLYSMIGRPNEVVSDFEKSFLSGCIVRAYAKKRTKTIVDDVIFEIEASISEDRDKSLPFDQRKADWVHYLYQYTTKGSSPDVFNKPSKLDPKASFICIETEGIPSKLKNPVMMALTIDIDNRIILSESSRPKGLVLEEISQLLKMNSKSLEAKFSEGAATYRKKQASLITITQNVSEYFETDLLKVIYNKSELKIVMRQGDDFPTFAKEKELFHEADIEQIKQFKKSSEARFSSFLLKNGSTTSIHQYYLDPFSKVLTSTRAEDMEAIKSYRKKGLSVEDSVERVMWDYYGDEAQALVDYRMKLKDQHESKNDFEVIELARKEG